MTLELVYQSQIESYNESILGFSGIISQFSSQGLTGNELASCFQQECNCAMANMNHVQNLKAEAEAKLARLQAGWTGTYLDIVNDIESGYTGVYTQLLQRWLAEDITEQYQPFFTMYGQATNSFQKDHLLKMTFGH